MIKLIIKKRDQNVPLIFLDTKKHINHIKTRTHFITLKLIILKQKEIIEYLTFVGWTKRVLGIYSTYSIGTNHIYGTLA